jgi:hypothetical protein
MKRVDFEFDHKNGYQPIAVFFETIVQQRFMQMPICKYDQRREWSLLLRSDRSHRTKLYDENLSTTREIILRKEFTI